MNYTFLQHINTPADLKHLSVDELEQLAIEIRHFIINIVSVKAGHLGANLGVVELTIAIHSIFDCSTNPLIWDVGHQAYTHKILTGRREQFATNRQLGGISGFPKREESLYDHFGVGHSSTSISAILGMAIASKLKEEYSKQHIAVIGDASIASGMAFEGLNHAGVTDANILIILNDNAIGIDPSIGALKNYFTSVKKGEKLQDNIFEALDFKYFGPIDGHDLPLLLKTLEELKFIKGPKLLHIITTKGKGLKQAEENQVTYHAPGKFDALTGELFPKDQTDLYTKFQDVFGLTLLELAKINKKIVGITPAMPTGSSLKYMMDELPERAFDVGIAEQHAVTFAAGLATQGFIPFCTIYSTFLQRAYDQIIHDVALQNLPVIFCVDRAGLVGEDGATHHGAFDISYLSCIPNLIIFSPRNEIELRNILYTAQINLKQPIAIRYPRGKGEIIDWKKPFKKIKIGKNIELKKGTEIAIISTGTTATNVINAIEELNHDSRIGHYDFRFIKPIDPELLTEISQNYRHIVVIENNSQTGGLASIISSFLQENNLLIPLISLGIPDQFIEHGTIEELNDIAGISTENLKNTLSKLLS
jgi:1-deoxy-D-xylulose-5-phosphate synthase